MKTISGNFFEAVFPGNRDRWYSTLDKLEKLALTESWSYRVPREGASNPQNPILENYILHTFKRLAYEYNNEPDEKAKERIFSIVGEDMCFNTGLYTKQYEEIYACLRKNTGTGSEPWFLVCFADTSDPFLANFKKLPRRARYFNNISELIYDTDAELRVNTAHILENPNNRDRIPEGIRECSYLTTLFNGAVDLAIKKVKANYKAAVPQFYDNQICFLLPICLTNTEVADLSLAVRWHDGYYTGHTCLTLDMAYNNARLIACRNSDWLNP